MFSLLFPSLPYMSRSQTARSQDISTYLPSNPNALSLSNIILSIYFLPNPIGDCGTNVKKIYNWKDQTPTFHRTCQVRSRAGHDHVSEVDARQHVTGCVSTVWAVYNAVACGSGRVGRRLEESWGVAYPRGLFHVALQVMRSPGAMLDACRL
jgi:hypothetical protein